MGHTEHDGEEDDRPDDHPHQVHEGVAERLHRLGGARREDAQQHAERDGDQDAEGQIASQPGDQRHARSSVKGRRW